jgi:glucose/arabinose dehydrogenase
MRIALLTVAVIVALAGCAVTPTPSPAPEPTAKTKVGLFTVGPAEPTLATTVITTDLTSPWSMVRLDSGSTLISERDTGLIKELQADGTVRVVGTIPGVVPGGEGGLLGIEIAYATLYAYFTSSTDNRIVRFSLLGKAGDYSLGAPEVVLAGISKARTHNGGRIKWGPDGMLYATTGDARLPSAPQDLASLNGKILRMTLDGRVPADNPFPDSYVYSYGHRNPQGLAWDDDGQLWEAELGKATWDEVNRIVPGGNYGWPIVEGAAGNASFIDPIAQWPTDDASPSGLAFTRDTLFLAALRGKRLWAIYPHPDGTTSTTTEWFSGVYGRIRDVVPGPDGSIWILTSNTDQNGTPGAGDDRIVQVELAPID